MNDSRREFLKRASAGLVSGSSIACRIASAELPAKSNSARESLVESVRYLGNLFLKNNVGVSGADGATSTVLPSGESLWLFGDTVEGPFKSIRNLALTNLRSNTAAIVSRQDASRGIRNFRFLSNQDGTRPRQIVPFEPNESPAKTRIWAVHGVSSREEVFLFYHRITLLQGVDVFVNFELNGMGLAKAKAADLQFSRLVAPDGTREFWKGNQPSFGVFVVNTSEYVYLWGSLMTGMFLARNKLASIEDLSSYEYLVQAPTLRQPKLVPRWSKTFEPTASLFDSVPNEMSAAYNSHLKKYVAIHSYNRENKIVMRTADDIVGPWSGPEVIYRPGLAGKDDLIYAAKEHPELALENGRKIFVSFVNSATYVPQLVEVVFK